MTSVTLSYEQVKLLLTGATVVTSDDVIVSMAKGSDIRDFYDNHWPDEYYYESENGELVLIDSDTGDWALEDSRLYDITRVSDLIPEGRGDVLPFAEAFRAWFTTKGRSSEDGL